MKTIKHNWIYLFFLGALALFLFTKQKKSKGTGYDKMRLSMQTFRTPQGWGYDLYTDDSVYIHQEYIPAVEGRKPFATETDASMIGTLALRKLRKSRFPVITADELDSCGIKR